MLPELLMHLVWVLVGNKAECKARRCLCRDGRFWLAGCKHNNFHCGASTDSFCGDKFRFTPKCWRTGMFQQEGVIEGKSCEFSMFIIVDPADLVVEPCQCNVSMLIVQIRDQFAQYMDWVLVNTAIFTRMKIQAGIKNIQDETRAATQPIPNGGSVRVWHAASICVQGKISRQFLKIRN